MAHAPYQGQTIRLTSRADGFAFDAYHVRAEDARRGGLVVLHAMWGVTPHLRELADSFAEDGYETIVPSLFDRRHRGFPEANLDEALRPRQAGYMRETDWSVTCGDIQAAVDALAGPVFAMGFCYGGTAGWMAAARCEGIAAASLFYGGGIAANVEETPRCPTVLHFGKQDELIPLADVEAIKARHPDVPIWLYEAGHAFMAPTDDYDGDSARLGRLRTLQFFHRATGKAEMGG